MNANEMFPSKYLKATEIGQHKPIVEIASIKVETLGQGDEQDQKPVVYFKGKDKGLVCNKTNWNTLIELFGPDTDNWIGRKIMIFAMEVDFKGKMTLSLRISLQRIGDNAQPAPRPVAPVNDLAESDIPF